MFAMAQRFAALVVFLELGSVSSTVRSLPDRVTVGECIDSTAYAGDTSLYSAKISEFPSPAVSAAEADVTAAELISIAYGNNFKVLTEKLSMEQYVLTQCGTSQPTDAEIDAVASGTGYSRKHFAIPVQRVAVAPTTLLPFFQRLGVEDRVAYLPSFAIDACWQKAVGCGASLESSYGGNATLRAQQLNEVEVSFMDCSGDCSNVKAQSNAVHVPATKDSGNLHSAEYIKFLAAFFNLEEVALQGFSDTVASYTARMESAANGPVVAWIKQDWQGNYELSQATYKLQLVTAAGGRNVDGAQIAQDLGSSMGEKDAVSSNPAAGKTYYITPGTDKAAEANTLMAALQDVDIIVDETYTAVPGDYNLSSFLSTFHLTSQSTHKFLSNDKVLRTDGLLSATGGWDWLESRIAYPDWAVTGLARYVTDNPGLTMKYFRNVATGEMPEVITADECTDPLPVCDASLFATPITLTVEMSKSFPMAMLSFPALLLSAMWF